MFEPNETIIQNRDFGGGGGGEGGGGGSSSTSTVGVELTLAAIKEFLVSNGGKVKYADLYNRFRDLIVDSTSGICLFTFE